MKRFALFSALLLLAPLAAQTQFAELGKSYLPRSANDFTESLVLGDVDGDGDLDLVLGNRVRQSKLYLNDGQGTFTDVTAARMPKDKDATSQIAMADVDLDGDPDLVVGILGGVCGGSRLYRNLHRELHAPFAPRPGSSYRLDLYAKPGYASSAQLAVTYLSFGELAPRLRIPPFGFFGLNPSFLFSLPAVVIPAPTGRASLPLPIPKLAALKGLFFYTQAILLHSQNVRDWRLTGVTADRLH